MERFRKLDTGSMRQNNLRLVLEGIYRNAGITKAGLAEKTGMSAMAAGRITDQLMERGLVLEEEKRESFGKGRPGKQLYLNREKLCHVGVSLDANGVFLGYVNAYGEIIHRASCALPAADRSPETVSDIVSAQILAFIRAHRLEDVEVVGLITPGLIHCEEGTVIVSSQLRWENVPLLEMLNGKLPGLRVVLDNDIKARAQAESRFGSAQGYGNAVLLNVGSGIGAGIIIHGDIYRGKENMAGEIGHIVINANGRLCECGRMGCLQANLTEPAILQEARAIRPDIDMYGLLDAWQQKEPWAQNLLHMVSGYLLMTINLLANAYAPEAIVLCGSLIDKGPIMRELITAAFENQYKFLLSNHFDLRYSNLGPDGNILGAATVALNHTLDSFTRPGE